MNAPSSAPASAPSSPQGGEREGDPRPRCRLYLITPADLECDPTSLAAFRDRLEKALDGGDVACVQLRLKGVSDGDWRRAIDALMPLVQARDVAFILNDRADLAAEVGADGVHLGQDDMACDDARALLGPDKIIGVTCKASRDLAAEAAEAGADYVAFGAFFESGTKPVTTPANPAILGWWATLSTLPAVAIGGVTAANCPPLIQAGADFLAVAGAVWTHPAGPAAAVAAFNAAIDATPHDAVTVLLADDDYDDEGEGAAEDDEEA